MVVWLVRWSFWSFCRFGRLVVCSFGCFVVGPFWLFVVGSIVVWSFRLLICFVAYVCWIVLSVYGCSRYCLHRVALRRMSLVFEFVTRWCNLSISVESNAECQTH